MKRKPLKTYYRRSLPYWLPPGRPVFVTWRLKDSLPDSAIRRLRETHRLLMREAAHRKVPIEDLKIRINKKVFAMLDEILDRAAYGPTWLKNPRIAEIVQNTLLQVYAHLYKLWAYVVMSNHVHVLLKPKMLSDSSSATESKIALEDIMKRLKGYSAREANKILGRTGMSFWQTESFDHWVRNEAEFYRVVRTSRTIQ
jgi:REP element-mobilizing transposase RayT